MMLDLVNLASEALARRTCSNISSMLDHRFALRKRAQSNAGSGRRIIAYLKLPPKVSLRIPVDSHMLNIAQTDPCLPQTIADSVLGKPAQCLTRRKRSSSAAATSFPSRTRHAAESP